MAQPTQLAKWMDDNDRDDATVAAAVSDLIDRPSGISRSQINRLKNGQSKPSYDAAAALEQLTGIPAGELFKPAQGAAA